jgi:uncharacterized coiled-coil protein SlyX
MSGQIPDRLTKLEENQGFAEHTLEQLNEELVQVNRRLAEALTRLDVVEQRIARLMGTVTEIAAERAEPDSPAQTPTDQPAHGYSH